VSTIDVLVFTEHWLSEDEISCYNLPNLSLVSKHCRKSRKNGGSGMYVQPNTLAKPIVNFGYFDLNKHFDVVLLKLLNLEITVNYLDKRKDQVIIIGDLKINVFKHDSTKKRLELLLNMSGLQAVINEPTRTQKETKSATKQVILNPQLWDFKTQVSETTFSDQFGQTLHQYHDSLQQRNLNPWITEQKKKPPTFTVLGHFETIYLKLFSQLWFFQQLIYIDFK
jgi:hypothetical protein